MPKLAASRASRQHLGRRPVGREAPLVEEHDLVGEAGRQREVVHDRDDDRARRARGPAGARGPPVRAADRGPRPARRRAGPAPAWQAPGRGASRARSPPDKLGGGAALEAGKTHARDGLRDRRPPAGRESVGPLAVRQAAERDDARSTGNGQAIVPFCGQIGDGLGPSGRRKPVDRRAVQRRRPRLRLTRPASVRSRVVLPAPFGPTTTVRRPGVEGEIDTPQAPRGGRA